MWYPSLGQTVPLLRQDHHWLSILLGSMVVLSEEVTMPEPSWTVLHKMHYEVDDGTAIWTCADCPKRVQVWPEYKVLEQGDTTVVHAGSSGGLQIVGVQVTQP